jgi:hypothetical protein
MRYQELIKICADSKPDLWKACCPRLYKHCAGFGDARIASLAVATGVYWVQNALFSSSSENTQEPPQVARVINIAASVLLPLKLPTFFIHREFASAALFTEPPKEMRWADMPLPFEGACFMLPHAFLRHPDEGEIAFLGYARLKKDKIYRFPQSHKEFQITQDNIFSVFTAAHEREGLPLLGMCFSSTEQPTIDLSNYTPTLSNCADKTPFDLPYTKSDSEFMNLAANLCFRLLLAITARPQFVETTGTRVGVHKKSGSELWTPNIIGRNYRIPVRLKSGTSAPRPKCPRLHWRRGHFRNQPIGALRKERKLIWLEPMLISGHAPRKE